MKKHILVVVAVLLSSPAFSQVLDYRSIYTGVYTCTWVDTTTATQTPSQGNDNFIVTINTQSNSVIDFSGPQNRLIFCEVNVAGQFYGAGNGGYYELYGNFDQTGQSFTAIEYTVIGPAGDYGSTRWYTCTKTAPLTIGEENALNGITMFYGDGLLTIRQPNNSVNRVRIFSIDGKELLNEPILSSTTQIPLTANTGMYLVAFYNNNTFTGSQKLVVK